MFKINKDLSKKQIGPITVDVKTHNRIKLLAKKNKMTMSELCRQMIDYALGSEQDVGVEKKGLLNRFKGV